MSFAEESKRLREAFRQLGREITKALGIDRLVDWLASRWKSP